MSIREDMTCVTPLGSRLGTPLWNDMHHEVNDRISKKCQHNSVRGGFNKGL